MARLTGVELLSLVAAAYGRTRLVALPPLEPEREPFDSLGVCTSSIETLGVLVALHVHRPRQRLSTTRSIGGTR